MKLFLIYNSIIVLILFSLPVIENTNNKLYSKTDKTGKIDSLAIEKFKNDSIQKALIKQLKIESRKNRKKLINDSKNILILDFGIEKNNTYKSRLKYDFIAQAFEKYLKENLINNNYIVDESKSKKLEQFYRDKKSLFLASREIFKRYEDYNYNSSIGGSFNIRGKIIKLNVEIYSNFKNRIVYKGEFKGRKSELLSFFKNVSQTIFNQLKYDIIPKNIFPVDNDNIFYKYLTLQRYEDDEKFEKAKDMLEDLDLSGRIRNCTVLQDMYKKIIAMKINENQTGKYIGDLFEKDNFYTTVKKDNLSSDKLNSVNTVAYVKDLINKGYKFILKNDILSIDKTDSLRASLIVDFQIKFKKAYRTILLRKINKKKGDKRWRNMGRYFFSKNDNENKEFISTLKDQIVKFTLYDKNDKELLEKEITIDLFDFEGGTYENLKKDPVFPLNPISPTINGFRITNKVNAVFVFNDVELEIIEKIRKSKIEILFE